MKSITHKKASFMLLFTLLIVYACTPFDNWGQNYPSLGANESSGDYLINPNTILAMLHQGDINVFLPMLATPGPDDELLPSGSFEWTQEDYLEISKALSLYVWKDKLEDWNVYYVIFRKDCHNASKGFDSFDIIYYKSITVNSESLYTTRQISIYPLSKQVTWGGETDYPQPFLRDWFSVDLNNFKVTADEALQLSEDNGGKDARLQVKDACNILVSSPHNNKQAWSVSYYVSASFQVIVDPYSGHFEVFNEFQ